MIVINVNDINDVEINTEQKNKCETSEKLTDEIINVTNKIKDDLTGDINKINDEIKDINNKLKESPTSKTDYTILNLAEFNKWQEKTNRVIMPPDPYETHSDDWFEKILPNYLKTVFNYEDKQDYNFTGKDELELIPTFKFMKAFVLGTCWLQKILH